MPKANIDGAYINSSLIGNSMNSGRSHRQNVSMTQKKSPSPIYKKQALDREERDLINLANNLSKEEIWEKLEQKRFTQLKQAAVNLQSELLFSNRCPKCTLVPPCKHYQTSEQILVELPHIIQQPEFKQHLSPKKREILHKTLKEQQKLINFSTQGDLQGSALLKDESSQIHGTSFHNQSHIHEGVNHSKLYQDESLNNMLQSTFGQGDQQHAKYETAVQKKLYLSNRANRNNLMNNTVAAPMGFRGMADHQQSGINVPHRPSKLSHYGANIMGGHRHNQFLKKRQGNGGSPVPGEVSRHNESKASDDSMTRGLMAAGAAGRQRDRTTVRIRTKNNQYLYGEGSFAHPLSSTKNQQNDSYFTNSQMPYQTSNMQDRERVQAMIAKYREEKIQKQIEKIEQEKMHIEIERQQQKEEELRRRKRNEELKQKLQQYQEMRYQEQVERDRETQEIIERQKQKEKSKKNYYESQKKYIVDYREQKKRTDQLLLIPQANPQQQQRNVYYNQFPSPKQKQQQQQQFKFNPVSGISNGIGGVQYINSGSGLVENAHTSSRRAYQDLNAQDKEIDDEQVYEAYYDEDDPEQQKQERQLLGNRKQTSEFQVVENQELQIQRISQEKLDFIDGLSQ